MRLNAPESVLFSKFFRGSMPPDPTSMASRLRRSLNWPDQIRFPSDGPGNCGGLLTPWLIDHNNYLCVYTIPKMKLIDLVFQK